jgi:hypothetical protein
VIQGADTRELVDFSRVQPNKMIFKGIVTVLVISGLLILSISLIPSVKASTPSQSKETIKKVSVEGVCPPFFLYDESGNVIDPVHGINGDKPYSPKQTCGKCHDYNKITEGFHFQQGRGEKPNPLTAERCLWVTSPGNYGGNW